MNFDFSYLDIAFKNGSVITVNETDEITEAVGVSVLDAIRCYTLHPAYASYQEDLKGSAEVGKLADLIVLSEDILKANPMDITSIKVDLTMIDGVVEYERA